MEGKKLKLSAIVLMGINLLVGAGIYLTPAKAYTQLGVHLFWILAICAILAIVMALVFAEMAGIFTKTGGVYVYVSEAFGGFWGFNIGFMRFIAAAVALAVQMTALPQMLSTIWPVFASPGASIALSCVFLIVLCGINLTSVRVYEIFVKFTSWLVLFSLIFTIIVGFFNVNMANFATPAETLVPPLTSTAAAGGFLLLFYAFVGFENIGVAAQDMENPTRDVPKAIISVLLIVTAIYFLLFFVVIGSFGSDLAVDGAVNANNAAAVVGSAFGAVGENIMLAFAFIALIGIGLAMSFAGPRNLVPIGADKYLPESLGQNNARGVPASAIVMMGIFSVIFIVLANVLSKDAFTTLVYVATLARLIQYMAVCLGLFSIRKKGMKGTFKLPMAGFFIILALLVCIFLFTQVPVAGLLGLLVLIIITLLVYFFYAKPRHDRLTKAG